MHRIQRDGRPPFQIHGLPDTGRTPVTLFALQFERMRRVVHAQHQTLRRVKLNVRREVEGKRRIATLVLTQSVAVQPGGRVPVARSDHEEHTLSLPRLRER